MIRRICSPIRRLGVLPTVLVTILVMNSIFFIFLTSLSSTPKARASNPTSLSTYSANDIPAAVNYTHTFPEVPPVQESLIHFVHSPKIICNKSDTPDILIVVHSYVENSGHRNVLRKTLGKRDNYDGLSTRLVFVTGKGSSKVVSEKLGEESALYGDLLTISVIDMYTRMVYKAIGWMKWVSSSCRMVKHIIKMDDDTFLHMFQLAKLYRTCPSLKPDPICNRMSCLLWKNFRPHRSGKYSLSISEYSRKSFPQFCPGVAIFIPGPLVERLLEASRNIQFLWLDDVYVTGLLMEYLGEDHYNFGHKMVDTTVKDYKSIASGKMYVGHFNKDVMNGVYEKQWKEIQAKYS